MTIRERLGKKNPSLETEQALRKDVPAVVQPVLHCVHRAWTPSGKIKCSCSNQPEVFVCENPWVSSGYCTPTMPVQAGDGPIVMADGSRIDPADNRFRTFMPWPLREGEHPHMAAVVVCSTCPRRADPPPHILKLKQIGAQGNWNADGHADIVNVLTTAEQWQQHARDYTDSSPDGFLSCHVATQKQPNLIAIAEATRCRLMNIHTAWADPVKVAEVATAFPSVKFWCVLHGSQNSMCAIPRWSKQQRELLELSERMPNVWYGTPEPAADFGKFGWTRYKFWPNTIPFDMPESPPPQPDIPLLLIAGRDEAIKGRACQVLAGAIVAKQRTVKVASSVSGNVGCLADVAKAARLELDVQKYRTPIAFRKYLRDSVSVVLNSTMTEATQYVGLDALSQGRPVVGSPAIWYLPKSWMADPNDPADIARVACMFLDDYPRYSAEALRLGIEIRDRQAEAYRTAIEHILGS